MGRMITSRESDRHPGSAKKAAEEGPVIVTDRGEPAFVLLTYEAFRRLSGDVNPSLVDLLRQEDGDFDFEPPSLTGDVARPLELD